MYQFVSCPSLGTGFSATVRPAQNLRTKEKVAIKTYSRLKINSSKVKEASYKNELKVLEIMTERAKEFCKKAIFFPCVSLISIHQNLRDINLVMDYAGSLNLEKFIKSSRFDAGYLSKIKCILKNVC